MNQRSLYQEYFKYVCTFFLVQVFFIGLVASDDLPLLPLGDQNSWYYPSHGYDSTEEDLHVGSEVGNWGNKTIKGARWVRRGKITPWGPGMDDWEASANSCSLRFTLNVYE